MIKTIFGKKLLLIATITVLVTGLTLAATFDDVAAKKGEPKAPKAPKAPKTSALDCKDNVGSFMAAGALFIQTGQSKCKSIGDAAFTAVTAFDSFGPGPNCITLVGAGLPTEGPIDFDGYGISKKGFFTFTVGPLVQCFYDKNGAPAPITLGATACGGGLAPANYVTSIVTGPFDITGGLIKGNVPSGDGMISTAVDHCAGGTAPDGNSAISTLTGTITA